MNNKNDFYIIAGVILAVIAFFTNPKQESHKTEITNKVLSAIGLNISKSSSNGNNEENAVSSLLGGALMDNIGRPAVQGLVNNIVEYKSYFLFSLSSILLDGDKKVVAFGIFGNVFVTDKLSDYVKEKMNSKSSSISLETASGNNIVGAVNKNEGSRRNNKQSESNYTNSNHVEESNSQNDYRSNPQVVDDFYDCTTEPFRLYCKNYTYIGMLQEYLNRRGANLTVDGRFTIQTLEALTKIPGYEQFDGNSELSISEIKRICSLQITRPTYISTPEGD